jgi:hypothetical protein
VGSGHSLRGGACATRFWVGWFLRKTSNYISTLRHFTHPSQERQSSRSEECSLNVSMFPECILNFSMFFECSLNAPWMIRGCSLNIPWVVQIGSHALAYVSFLIFVLNQTLKPVRAGGTLARTRLRTRKPRPSPVKVPDISYQPGEPSRNSQEPGEIHKSPVSLEKNWRFRVFSLLGEVRNFKPTPSLPMTRLLALSVSVSTAPNRNAIQAVDFILLSPFFF